MHDPQLSTQTIYSTGGVQLRCSSMLCYATVRTVQCSAMQWGQKGAVQKAKRGHLFVWIRQEHIDLSSSSSVGRRVPVCVTAGSPPARQYHQHAAAATTTRTSTMATFLSRKHTHTKLGRMYQHIGVYSVCIVLTLAED